MKVIELQRILTKLEPEKDIDFKFGGKEDVQIHPEIIEEKGRYILSEKTDMFGKIGEGEIFYTLLIRRSNLKSLWNIIKGDKHVLSSRKKEYVESRTLFYYICIEYRAPNLSIQAISDFFGHTHSTAHHHHKKVKSRMEVDQKYKAFIRSEIQKLLDREGIEEKKTVE
jgi:hypothetical protein